MSGFEKPSELSDFQQRVGKMYSVDEPIFCGCRGARGYAITSGDGCNERFLESTNMVAKAQKIKPSFVA